MRKITYVCDSCKMIMDEPFMTLSVKYKDDYYDSEELHICRKCYSIDMFSYIKRSLTMKRESENV